MTDIVRSTGTNPTWQWGPGWQQIGQSWFGGGTPSSGLALAEYLEYDNQSTSAVTGVVTGEASGDSHGLGLIAFRVAVPTEVTLTPMRAVYIPINPPPSGPPPQTVSPPAATAAASAPVPTVTVFTNLFNDFETGNTNGNGTTITPGNSGQVGPPLDNAFTGTAGGPTYGNAHTHDGSFSMSMPTSGGLQQVVWKTNGLVFYARAYLWINGTPTSQVRWIQGDGDVNLAQWRVSITTGGLITVNINGGTPTTGAVPISTGQWIRLEARFELISGGATANIEAKLFNSPESLTPSETITQSGAAATAGGDSWIDAIRFGTTAAAGFNSWADDVGVLNTGYLGPTGGASNQEVDPPAATASASAPIPAIQLKVPPAAAASTASSNVPTYPVSPPAATSAASANLPGIATLPLLNNFDTGQSSGTTITTGNSNGGTGNYAFTNVTGAPTYSSVEAHSGTLSMLSIAAGTSHCQWNSTAFGLNLQTLYGCVYVYPTAVPTSSFRFIQGDGNVVTDAFRISMSLTTGVIIAVVNDGTTSSTHTGSIGLTLNSWNRVEFQFALAGGNGTTAYQIFVGANADGVTPDETGTISRALTDSSLAQIYYGPESTESPTVFYLDDLNLNQTGYPGPQGVTNQTVSPPTATASASAPIPGIALTVSPAAATASASSPVPVPQLKLSPAAATASASAPGPVMPITVPVATASANSPPPIPALQVSPAAATASASAPLPTIQLQVPPAAATASASAPVPTYPISAPTATSSASAPLPVPKLQVSPAAATASASAPLPTIQLQVSPAAATASASAPVPTYPIVAPAATASASAPVPLVTAGLTLFPPAATASASAPIPGVQLQINPEAAQTILDNDTFTRTVGSGLGTSDTGNTYGTFGSSISVNGSVALLSSVASTGVGAYVNGISQYNEGGLMQISFASLPNDTVSVFMFSRLQPSFATYYNAHIYLTSGGFVGLSNTIFTNATSFAAPGSDVTLDASWASGHKYWLRFETTGSTIQWKGWLDGNAEPVAWSFQTTDTSVTAPGTIGFQTFGGAGLTSGPNVSFDNFQAYTLTSGQATSPQATFPVSAPSATSAASAPLPAIQLQVPPGAATASASALVPTPQLQVPPAAATSSASAPLPAIQLKVSPAAATASASSNVPTYLVSPPTATASASAPLPVVNVSVVAPVATASASAPLPAIQLQIPPAAATASASAPSPTMPVSPPAATASASAPAPAITSLPLANNFDTGQTNTTVITTGNSGGGTGNTAWASVVGSPTYSSVLAHSGTLSMLSPAAAISRVAWDTTSFGVGLNQLFGCVYINPSAIPTNSFRFIQGDGNVITDAFRVSMSLTTGVIIAVVNDGTTSSTHTGTIPLTLNSWNRVEYQMQLSGGNGIMSYQIFVGANCDGITPDETGTISRALTDASIIKVSFGPESSETPTTVYFDDVNLNNTGYPGPFFQTVSAPVATASASALVPAIFAGELLSPPAATASASAPVPTPQLKVPPAAATASETAPAPTVPLAPPSATSSATAPTPTIKLQVPPGAATASASAPLPGVTLTVPPASATASASAPLPTVQLKVSPASATASASANAPIYPISVPAATASASAPAPTMPVVAPAATSSASAPLPSIQIKVSPAAATASASALVPQVFAGQIVSPPVATASASAPLPTPQLKVPPGAATSSASAPTPTMQLKVSPAAATASASAPNPIPKLAVPPGAATAAASAIVPGIADSDSVPAATASASAPTPLVEVSTGGIIVNIPSADATGFALVPQIHILGHYFESEQVIGSSFASSVEQYIPANHLVTNDNGTVIGAGVATAT